MTNKEVYAIGKYLKVSARRMDTTAKMGEARRDLREMCRKGLITSTQRNYLTGIILKYAPASNCVANYYSLGDRKYNNL